MKKGIIVGLIALTLLVGAFFIMLPQVLPQASEPDPELKFAGCNLSFADTIYVKYAVKGNDLSGVKLLIWTNPQNDYLYGSQSYVLNSIGTETVSGVQCLVFQYNKLAAKQMGDVIYARAFVEKQGNAYYSEVKKYSVLQYVYNKTGRTGTASTNQKLIDLLEAMLEYGAKAQIYTNYKTNRLVSSNYYQVNVVGGMLPDGCDSGLYALGETVTLTAPSTDLEGNAFSYWENDDGENVGTTATLDVTVISRNRTYTAVYGVETPVITDPEYSTGLAYTDNGDGTCTVTGIGTCTDLDVLIPPSIDGLTVTNIGEKAFENQTALTDIVIPDTVTTIGRRAFYGCTGLTEFTIPSSVTNIGMQIFYKADNIHTVFYNAAYYPSTDTENPLLNNAGITKVVFGGAYIGEYAARNLGMNGRVTEVEIDYGVTEIGEWAFYGITGIASIEIPDSVMSIGSYAFYGCTNLTNVRVSATSLGMCAFGNLVNLETVTMGDGVTSIGHAAFSGCTNLTSVVIPESVTWVESGAFSNCTSITMVNYIGEVEEWCHISFGSRESNPCCDGASLYIGGELLTEAVIPDSVSSIGNYTFYSCTSLTSIEIPDSVTSIGDCAFNRCTSLSNIEIPDSVTSIGSYAFADCRSIAHIVIPDSVTSIGTNAFSGCTSLTSMVIPDSVTNIGSYVFSGCSNLASIEIPDSVTSIDYGAFNFCTSLLSVEMPDSVTSIGSYAFADCRSIAHIVIPDSVTSIGDSVFCGCSSLVSIEIPDSVTSIGNRAFLGCTSLANIAIPNNVISIGDFAFSNCTSIAGIVIPDRVARVGQDTFSFCASLISIEIPNSVTVIGQSALYGCTSLSQINFNGTKEEWNAIEKGPYWDTSAGCYNIYCTDGVIPLSCVLHAYQLQDGETMDGTFTLTGEVVSVDTEYSEQYSNVTVTIVIEGSADYPIQCFRLKNGAEIPTGQGVEIVDVGDIITVTGSFKNFRGVIELVQGCELIDIIHNP